MHDVINYGMSLAIVRFMIIKYGLSILICCSFSAFADEPSAIYEGLKKVEARVEELKEGTKSLKAMTVPQAEQKRASFEIELKAVKQELEGLKQQYAADITGDEKPQVLGRNATKLVADSFLILERDMVQSVAVAAAAGVIKSTLEQFKQQGTILDFSLGYEKEWTLSLKGNFKNFPETYALKADEENSLIAKIQIIEMQFIVKDTKQAITMAVSLASFLQTLTELQTVLKSGVPQDLIKAVLEQKQETANFNRPVEKGTFFTSMEAPEYYYSLVSVDRVALKSAPAE